MYDQVMELRWTPIPDTEGLYDARADGVLRSHDRIVLQKNGRSRAKKGADPLRPRVNERGYHEYTLYVPGRPRRVVQGQVLILETFVGPRPEGKPQIRHLNGNPGDNRVENLLYATHIENRADMTLHGRDHYATRTHCKWGHPYEEQWNIQPFKGEGDKRICRACNCATSALNRNGANRKESPRLFKVVGDFYLKVFREGRDPRGCLTPAIYASLVVIASRQAPLDIPKPREEGE